MSYNEDYFQESPGVDISDTFRRLTEELEDMDIPDNLSLEDPALMSSEFFDSVLSLEEQTSNFDSGTNSDNISSYFDSDFGLNSDPEELRMNYNCSPDSVGSNYEIPQYTATTNKKVEVKDSSNIIVIKQPRETITKLATTTTTAQVPANIILNNPNGKKVIVTKPYARNHRKNMSNAKHIYKVQSISGNGRTVFLPFNVAKMKNIKIINGKGLYSEPIQLKKPATVPVVKYENTYSVSSPDSVDDDSDSFETKRSRPYPVLVLNEEEKRLLSKEGIRLPTHYPLTKNEEKELKRIRRKIRNKISAQDSRKRKKEYVDGLEERLKQNAEEKKILMNRVKALQQQNNSLVSQMQKLQSLVFNTNKVTPTTCLLIVLMSVLLVSLPNLNITKARSIKDEQQVIARRSLLSSQAVNEDNGSLEEFLLFNGNQKSKITTYEDEPIDENDSYTYFYDESDRNQKKSYLETDIDKEVRSTIDKMKDFFKNQLEYNNDEILPDKHITRKFGKRLLSGSYEYVPPKISKIDVGEFKSESTSKVSLHLANE